jgi:hypothetical protein
MPETHRNSLLHEQIASCGLADGKRKRNELIDEDLVVIRDNVILEGVLPTWKLAKVDVGIEGRAAFRRGAFANEII